MMFFKSKWFWICAVFAICGLIFLGFVIYQANQPPEVIVVYEVALPTTDATPKFPKKNSAPVPTPQTHEARETDAFIEIVDDTSHYSEHRSDEFPYISDDYFADEQPPSDVTGAQVDVLNENAAKQAVATLAAEKLAELRIKIPIALQERLDLLDLVEEYAEFSRENEEIYLLRREAFEKSKELRKTIFSLRREYSRYSDGDISPFQPGGEFYDLFAKNHIGVKKIVE